MHLDIAAHHRARRDKGGFVDNGLAVADGDSVQAGQALAVVEAMKMENILRAEQDGVVAAVKAGPGDSLAADQVIIEFE